MKHYKEVEVPAKTEKRHDFTTCDLCKEKITDDSKNWSMNRVTIEKVEGSVYPEGGYTDNTKYDLCFYCFDSKLAPFLNELGAQASEYEVDF